MFEPSKVTPYARVKLTKKNNIRPQVIPCFCVAALRLDWFVFRLLSPVGLQSGSGIPTNSARLRVLSELQEYPEPVGLGIPANSARSRVPSL